MQSKDRGFRHQEKEWRMQLNTAKAESATMSSRLKSKEAALLQASADLDDVHKQAGQLRTQLEDSQWEVESLQKALDDASHERDSAMSQARKMTQGASAENLASGNMLPTHKFLEYGPHSKTKYGKLRTLLAVIVRTTLGYLQIPRGIAMCKYHWRRAFSCGIEHLKDLFRTYPALLQAPILSIL